MTPLVLQISPATAINDPIFLKKNCDQDIEVLQNSHKVRTSLYFSCRPCSSEPTAHPMTCGVVTQHCPPTNRASLSLALLSVARILLRLSCLRRRRSTESFWRGSPRCPAWLLLLFCAASRASYFLRVVHPEHSFQFALRHDAGIRQCLENLVHTPITQSVWEMASLPFGIGGLSLRHAERLRTTACWSSWADTLPMLRQFHPQVADHILVSLSQGRGGFHLEAAGRESEPSHERRSGRTRVG